MECLLQSVTSSHISPYLAILFCGPSWLHPHLIHNLLELLDSSLSRSVLSRSRVPCSLRTAVCVLLLDISPSIWLHKTSLLGVVSISLGDLGHTALNVYLFHSSDGVLATREFFIDRVGRISCLLSTELCHCSTLERLRQRTGSDTRTALSFCFCWKQRPDLCCCSP